MSEILHQFILWKPLKIVSAIIYAVVVLLIPLSTFWSAVLLFALICLWSRIPCLVSMFTKDFDVIDFFVVMLAIHVGGIFGGLFGAAIMMFSRIFGPNEWFIYTVKDSISIMVCGFLTPLFYSLLGSALYAIYAFTALRLALYLILTIFVEPDAIALELGLCSMSVVVAPIYNTIIMKNFEGPLLNVFEGGLHFSWGLFLFATLVIGGFYLFGKLGRIIDLWKTSGDVFYEEKIEPWAQRPPPW
ncbi:hypothetical protein KY328_05155 [Candidatus Woesearchaeota archaeon]|nr:hypothetical protein [Candidatus Woesearchaeota archaeon]MBW3022287.1 hypothetical protein [Candidatus Woesearchaeota archaeon]